MQELQKQESLVIRQEQIPIESLKKKEKMRKIIRTKPVEDAKDSGDSLAETWKNVLKRIRGDPNLLLEPMESFLGPMKIQTFPLVYAAQCDNKNSLHTLVQLHKTKKIKPDFTICDENGRTAFHWACLSLDRSILHELLKFDHRDTKVGINCRAATDDENFCPAKEYLNIKDSLGNTPLHCAALSGSTAAIDLLLLLDCILDLDITNSDNLTPLGCTTSKEVAHTLIRNGASTEGMAQSAGALVPITEVYSKFIAQNEIDKWIGPIQTGDMQWCQEKLKSDPNAVNDKMTFYVEDIAQYCQPLVFAAAEGQVQIVKLILEHGCDINMKDTLGYTAILQASYFGFSSVFYVLIGYPELDIEANYEGNTALHLAVEQNQLGYVKVLWEYLVTLKKEFLINKANDDGNTPLHLSNNDYDTSKWLLEHGAEISVNNKLGQNPFHLAAENNNTDMLRLLYDSPMMPDDKLSILNAQDCKGNTAMHLAAKKGNFKVVQMGLLLDGIDVELKNKNGKTAMVSTRNLKIQNLFENYKKTNRINKMMAEEMGEEEEEVTFGIKNEMKLKRSAEQADEKKRKRVEQVKKSIAKEE